MVKNMKEKCIIMDSKDNVATSIEDISSDTEIQIGDLKIKINQNIPLGHKIALKNISVSEKIIKYAQVIGIATKAINIGDWVHIHNITSAYLEAVKHE